MRDSGSCCRNVAQHHSGGCRVTRERRFKAMICARSEARAQRRRQVDARPAASGRSACLRFRNGQAQARDQFLRLRQLGAAHGLEVGVLQQLALGKSEAGVDFDFLLLAALPAPARASVQGFARRLLASAAR